jgi:hypothetical protein
MVSDQNEVRGGRVGHAKKCRNLGGWHSRITQMGRFLFFYLHQVHVAPGSNHDDGMRPVVESMGVRA